jgi:hypothetical protein
VACADDLTLLQNEHRQDFIHHYMRFSSDDWQKLIVWRPQEALTSRQKRGKRRIAHRNECLELQNSTRCRFNILATSTIGLRLACVADQYHFWKKFLAAFS